MNDAQVYDIRKVIPYWLNALLYFWVLTYGLEYIHMVFEPHPASHKGHHTVQHKRTMHAFCMVLNVNNKHRLFQNKIDTPFHSLL